MSRSNTQSKIGLKNEITIAKVRPSSDSRLDHNAIVCKLKTKLKAQKKNYSNTVEENKTRVDFQEVLNSGQAYKQKVKKSQQLQVS